VSDTEGQGQTQDHSKTIENIWRAVVIPRETELLPPPLPALRSLIWEREGL
jgi:hypothetical protein